MEKIRTRFAPSPTGYMHVGGIRTALFAWLIAKQNNGVFALRVEDTDRAREVEGSIRHIINSLEALGLTRDEGPDAGGDYGPYLQSQRLESYKKWATKLYEDGKAYADPYTTEELQEFRDQAQAEKRPFLYRKHRPSDPPKWDGSQPLRLKVDATKPAKWHDEVRGDLTAGEDSLDDFILMKADGYPTYNFAHIIDDHEMKITHVVRGEEFISSTPKYVKLYEALGFDVPKLITVPPILNKDGGKKLSKRDGAKDVLEYLEEGFLPDALLNYLASLGWNDGTEQEIFTKIEMIDKFKVERIQSGGAKWDDDRLLWMNGHHIRNKTIDELYDLIDEKYWPKAANDESYKKKVLSLVQEKLKKFDELTENTQLFFEYAPPSKNLLKKDFKPDEIIQILADIKASLNKLTSFTAENIEKCLRSYTEKQDLHTGKAFRLIRVAVCGGEVAPGLFETIELLGQAQTDVRLQSTIAQFE